MDSRFRVRAHAVMGAFNAGSPRSEGMRIENQNVIVTLVEALTSNPSAAPRHHTLYYLSTRVPTSGSRVFFSFRMWQMARERTSRGPQPQQGERARALESSCNCQWVWTVRRNYPPGKCGKRVIGQTGASFLGSIRVAYLEENDEVGSAENAFERRWSNYSTTILPFEIVVTLIHVATAILLLYFTLWYQEISLSLVLQARELITAGIQVTSNSTSRESNCDNRDNASWLLTITCPFRVPHIIMDSKKANFVKKVKNMIRPGASSGFFKKAKHVTVTGGIFNEVHGDVCPEFVDFFLVLNSHFIADHPQPSTCRYPQASVPAIATVETSQSIFYRSKGIPQNPGRPFWPSQQSCPSWEKDSSPVWDGRYWKDSDLS